MGALCHEPEYHFETEERALDLDQIAEECQCILTTDSAENLDELFRLGGSSVGARPKILTQVISARSDMTEERKRMGV